MNRNNRLALPNAVQITAHHVPLPTAQQSSIVMQQPGEMKAIHFGGFTKLEEAALRLAQGAGAINHDRGQALVDQAVTEIVDTAAAILAECAKRQQPPDEDETPALIT